MSRKRVSFAETQKAYCDPSNSLVDKQKKRALCWYTNEELEESRVDARQAIDALHRVGGEFEAVDDSKHCIRGIEKYADMVEKVTLQKRLVDSVLHQQDLNRQTRASTGEDQIAFISCMLSDPFKEVAKYHANKNANEVKSDEDYTSLNTLEDKGVASLKDPRQSFTTASKKRKHRTTQEEHHRHLQIHRCVRSRSRSVE